MDIVNEVNSIYEKMISWRRHIHQNPEISNQVPNTTAFIKDQLEQMGYRQFQRCRQGIIALAGQEKSGKTLLLRSDMDALPMEEHSNLPFASAIPKAHTCGHDLHMAMLLGTAYILKKHEKELKGCVKLVFQPDEEGLTGASGMIEDGVLESPHVDAAIGIHVLPGSFSCDSIGCSSGPVMASSDRFRITILGKGGHGAIPHKARNPINAATDIVTSLQELSAYEIDAMQPNVITVCSLHAGDAPNIIPEQAQLEGSVRTYDEKVREEVKKRIQEIAILSSKKFRNQCCVAFTGSTPPLINNEGLINLITSSLTKTNLNIIPFPRMMISDDFAQYSQRVPAAYLAIGAGGNEPQYKNGVLHDPKVIFNENALCSGAIALSVCSFSFCNGAFG